MVPGPGLEPGYSASKADVLPIRRSRNCREKFSREVSIRPNTSLKNVWKPGDYGAMRRRKDSAKLKNLQSRAVATCCNQLQ